MWFIDFLYKMKRIGLLSDTHCWLDPKVKDFFKDCDEVWHCGDIGDLAVAEELESSFNLRAVYGNIDGGVLRRMFSETLIFNCEGVKTMMTHIGGYPKHYDSRIKDTLYRERPQLFVCGHSHILKVMYDETLSCLHMNPGAAGIHGFHQVRTAIRFVIEKGNIKDLEILELEKKR